ncbi:hypothetical protein C0J52_07318 [Blattella germanica]|nr:hypothetical protein C0J52_07318 [Blattella germanica]
MGNVSSYELSDDEGADRLSTPTSSSRVGSTRVSSSESENQSNLYHRQNIGRPNWKESNKTLKWIDISQTGMKKYVRPNFLHHLHRKTLVLLNLTRGCELQEVWLKDECK